MGITNSQINPNKYKFLEERKDKVYGKVQLYSNCGNLYAQKDYVITSQKELTYYQEYLKQRKQCNSLLNVEGYQFESIGNSYFCGSGQMLKVMFEYCQTDLLSEIRTRSLQCSKFSIDELTRILNDIIFCLASLQEQGYYIGDLTPSQLLYNRTIKIMDLPTNRQANIYLNKVLSGKQNQQHYLSPSQLEFDGRIIDQHKSDVWCLGIVFLEMLHLANLSDIVVEGKILKERLDNYIDICSYGFFFKQLLFQMLNFEDKKRPTFTELLMWIQNYSPKDDLLQDSQQNYNCSSDIIVQPTLGKILVQNPHKKTNSQGQEPFNQDKYKNSRQAPDRQKLSLKLTIESIKKNYLSDNNPIEVAQPIQRSSCKPIVEVTQLDKKKGIDLQELNILNEKTDQIKREFSLLQRDITSPKLRTDSSLQESFLSLIHEPQSKSDYICETYKDGSIYEGTLLDGKRNGYGSFYYADGGFYVGEWFQGHMSGKGTLYYPSGQLAYKGQWLRDRFQGQGIVFNQSPLELESEFDCSDFNFVGSQWERYEGQFKQDIKEGNGILYLTNGEKYVGQFSDDMVHGKGQFYTGTQIIEGMWIYNKLTDKQIR